MDEIKQYILINSSLGMTHGKTCISSMHASMKIFLDMMTQHSASTFCMIVDPATAKWMNGSFTKVVLKIPSEKEIMEGIEIARKLHINTAIINDNGTTQVPPGSLTAAAIGPFNTKQEKDPEMMNWLSRWKLY